MESADTLRTKSCQPCEGGVAPIPRKEATAMLAQLDGWTLQPKSKSIRREMTFDDFGEAIEFVNRIAELAENEGHHPDLHLTGYKHLSVELTTHAIRGLSENDFILAAKIDELADEEGIEDSAA